MYVNWLLRHIFKYNPDKKKKRPRLCFLLGSLPACPIESVFFFGKYLGFWSYAWLFLFPPPSNNLLPGRSLLNIVYGIAQALPHYILSALFISVLMHAGTLGAGGWSLMSTMGWNYRLGGDPARQKISRINIYKRSSCSNLDRRARVNVMVTEASHKILSIGGGCWLNLIFAALTTSGTMVNSDTGQDKRPREILS